MAYQVLARKYRPQRFSDVIGQDYVTRTLFTALRASIDEGDASGIAKGNVFARVRKALKLSPTSR